MKLPKDQSIERADYAARQAELLDALIRGDRFPPGFDITRAATAGLALRRKRARAVRQAWPALSTALGPDFDPLIDGFLRAHTSPGGGLTDGLAFARSLGDPALTEDVRIEILLARGASTRVFVGMLRLADSRRLIAVLRVPGLGLRVCCLPLGRPEPRSRAVSGALPGETSPEAAGRGDAGRGARSTP